MAIMYTQTITSATDTYVCIRRSTWICEPYMLCERRKYTSEAQNLVCFIF